MATVVKDLGAVTAYAYAVEGGYTGTESEFEALLGNIAEDLSEIENLSVTVTTLPAGSSATASYSNGVLSLGIPKGDKGDKGDTGATGATGPQGIPGDVANLASAYSTSSTYGVGDYCIYNSQLYRCTTPITTAEAWTAAHWTAAVLGNDVTDLKSALDDTTNSYLFTKAEKTVNYSNVSGTTKSTSVEINIPAKRRFKVRLTDIDTELLTSYNVDYSKNGTKFISLASGLPANTDWHEFTGLTEDAIVKIRVALVNSSSTSTGSVSYIVCVDEDISDIAVSDHNILTGVSEVTKNDCGEIINVTGKYSSSSDPIYYPVDIPAGVAFDVTPVDYDESVSTFSFNYKYDGASSYTNDLYHVDVDDTYRISAKTQKIVRVQIYVQASDYSVPRTFSLRIRTYGQLWNTDSQLNAKIDNAKAELDSDIDELAFDLNGNYVTKKEAAQVQIGDSSQITVHIPNDTGATIENATIRLGLHRGTRIGDEAWNEIWSADFAKTMWNVRPFNGDGNPLTYDLHWSGNADFVRDSDLVSDDGGVLVFSDGTLVKSVSKSVKIAQSGSVGEMNWTNAGITGYVGWVDSRDRLFVMTGTNNATIMMYQYSSGSFGTGTEILNLESDGAQLDISALHWTEDENHNVYYGLYRVTWGLKIYKLGASASSFGNPVYENSVGQHSHRIWYDLSTHTIFAGVDETAIGGPAPFVAYSTDYGANWATFQAPYRACDQGIFFKDGDKYFGSGEPAVLGGYGLYSTTDPYDPDTYQSEIDLHIMVRQLAKPNSNTLLAFGGASKDCLYPQIFVYDYDQQHWTTCYTDDIDTPEGAAIATGATRIITGYVIPAGATERQIISTGTGRDYGLRIFVGGNHYYGLMFINVGDIPSGGKDITLYTGYVFDGGELSKSYNYTETPVLSAKAVSGKITVNGTDAEITNAVTCVPHDTFEYGALANKQISRAYVAKLGVSSYVKLGGVNIDKLSGTTVEIDLKPPTVGTWKTLGNVKNYEYIFSNNAGTTYLRFYGTSGQLSLTIGGTSYVIDGGLPPIWRFGDPAQLLTITFVIESDKTLNLYCNGGKYKTKTGVVPTVKWNEVGDLYLAKPSYSSGNAGAYTYGISGLRIYDFAMTDNEASMYFYRRNYV